MEGEEGTCWPAKATPGVHPASSWGRSAASGPAGGRPLSRLPRCKSRPVSAPVLPAAAAARHSQPPWLGIPQPAKQSSIAPAKCQRALAAQPQSFSCRNIICAGWCARASGAPPCWHCGSGVKVGTDRNAAGASRLEQRKARDGRRLRHAPSRPPGPPPARPSSPPPAASGATTTQPCCPKHATAARQTKPTNKIEQQQPANEERCKKNQEVGLKAATL